MTRRRLYVLGIGTLLLLVAGAMARVCQQPWADPLEVAAGKIKVEMTLAEVEAIVGREADEAWYPGGGFSSKVWLTWFGERGSLRIACSCRLRKRPVISSEWQVSDPKRGR
jgi:hypothetical protein